MSKKLAVNVLLRDPESGDVKVYEAGQEVPSWAKLADHFTTGSGGGESDEPRETEAVQDSPNAAPARNASVEDWRAYAVTQGADDAEVSESSRADLIAAYAGD